MSIQFPYRILPILTVALLSGSLCGEEEKPVGAGVLSRNLQWRKTEAVDHRYLVFLPNGYDPEDEAKKWPMIVYLHGGGGTAKGTERKLAGLRNEPFVLLAPICPPAPKDVRAYQHNWDPEIIGAIVRRTVGDHAVDSSRITLMGFSMGGSGAWETPYWHPGLFEKVVVMSGVCHPWYLKHYPEIPVRVYSGETEEFQEQQADTVKAAKKFGVDVHYTVWKGAGHGACAARALKDPSLRRWLRGEGEEPDS